MISALRRLNPLRLSVRARLGLIQLQLLVALCVVAIVAWHAVTAERGTGQALAMLNHAARYDSEGTIMEDALRTDVAAALRVNVEDSRPAAEVLASVRSNSEEFEAHLTSVPELDFVPELASTLAALSSHAHAYVALANRLVSTAVHDHERALALEPEFDASYRRMLQINEAMTELIDEQAQARERELLQEGSSAKLWIVVVSILTALLAGGLVAVIAGSIRQSLRQVCEAARALATGNLSARSEIASQDEVGELAVSLNKMADDLQNMVDRLLAEADRDAFAAQLTQALEMAENETDVYDAVGRAMSEISADLPIELMVSDSQRATLRRVVERPMNGGPGCGVESASGCPAMRRGAPMVFEDSETLNACPRLRQRSYGPISATCVPVTFMGRSFGVLHAVGTVGKPLPTQQAGQLTALGMHAGARIGSLRAFERTRMHAYTDTLTGLSNRRALEQVIQDLTSNGSLFTFALVDLDQFKKLNDTHGHDAGDKALRQFADTVRKCIRQADHAARWGGEEFAIVFPFASAEQALEVVQRIRAELAQALLVSDGVPFTASFGIADTSMAASFEDLSRMADEALYRSKDSGRDRATVAPVRTKAVSAPEEEPHSATDALSTDSRTDSSATGG